MNYFGWYLILSLLFWNKSITVGQGERMQMGLPQGQRNGLWAEKLEDWQSHCIMFLARETLLSMCLSTPRSKNKQRPTFKEAFNWELLYRRGLHGNQFSFILNLRDLLVTKTIMHCSISPEIHHQGYLFVFIICRFAIQHSSDYHGRLQASLI